MKISGSYTLDAPRQLVWEAPNDLDVLARIVPGCQRLEQTAENEFEGTLKIGIAAIKGIYSGKIRLEDVDPPRHYKLIAAGRSANAVIDGIGFVTLEEQDDKTILNYSGDADIGGTLASVGQRLMEGASRQMLNQSLKALSEQISQRMDAAAHPVAEAPVPDEVSSTADVLVAAPAGATTAEAKTRPFAAPPVQPPEPPQQPLPTTERRAVIVPESEQLKPEAVMQGMIGDFIAERPWLPWVIIAFLVGYLFGRTRPTF